MKNILKYAFYIFLILSAAFLYILKVKMENKAKIIKSDYSMGFIKESLNYYKRTYGTFPPSYTTNTDGSYSLNWKVLTLPFTDYNNNFLTIIDDRFNNRSLVKVRNNVPEMYFEIHNAFEKKRENIFSTNDFACFGIESKEGLFLNNSQTIDFILFSKDELVDFFENGIKMISTNEFLDGRSDHKIIEIDIQQKRINNEEQIKDEIENKLIKILNDKKDEDIIIGAFLLAGELRFIKNGSKLHMSIKMFDDNYSELSKKIKENALKKIEKRS
jgi:hypothetical protein